MAVLHQPSTNKKLKRVSRLVILPDYQGIGLGTKFLNVMAKIYINLGYDFSIITSAKNLINALRKSDEWCMYRYSIVKDDYKGKSKIDSKIKHRKCYTASFIYKK
jgi:GNAT superfamily N-acetyltransferase